MKQEELIKLLDFADYYYVSKSQMEDRIPYHLNVIDELYINENGHSRILAKLLQYRSESSRYELLESLIGYICEVVHSESFASIKVKKPEITQEKERIDLWVRDMDYAIIFENKIYNAADQESQLGRYIEKTIGCGYPKDGIFLVYLSQNGEEPDCQSWGGYKDAFQNRYVNLSFGKHINPWLKEWVLPNIRIKETILRSALEQYIDYLDGLFDLRTQNNTIRMETERLLVERLNLNQIENDFDKVAFLQDKVDELYELSNQLVALKDKYYCQAREKALLPYIKKWDEEVRSLFPQYDKCKVDSHVGLLVPYKGEYVNVRISEDDDKQMYCQIDKYGIGNEELSAEVMELTGSLLTRHGGNKCYWKYFGINDFEGVFSCFKEVMELLVRG